LDSLKRVAGNWVRLFNGLRNKEDKYYSQGWSGILIYQIIIMKSMEVDVEGKRYEVRVKEVTGWIPSFKKEEHKHESEEVNQPQAFEKQGEGDDDSEEDMDDEFLADTFAKEEEDINMKENNDLGSEQNIQKWSGVLQAVENDQLDEVSSINQQNERERWRNTSGGENYNENSENVANSFRCSQPNNVVGFSILNKLEEAIQFGKALGIDMDGCADDMEKLINGIGAKGAVEGSLEIGNLADSSSNVYAPQDVNANFLLWYRLQILISRFNGESIIMGDFNVVRVLEERMGSEFNINMAESFNNFIMENDLVDVSLGGY
ncbi:RNA-directed DNA polymerase, eukaryota, partial [Tanacetum coccineum]